MNKPFLIQRLCKPLGDNPQPTTPFSFGAGYIDGGMGKKFLEAVKFIFRFDYMGAAEFEWGEVPRAFKMMGKNREKSNLSAGVLKLKKEVYYIAPKDCEEKIVKYIHTLATKGDYDKSINLKEWTNLKRNIDEEKLDDTHSCFGWLELDTGFMFFIDKNMFEKTLKLFALEKKDDGGSQ